jgi:hypothetical protein
MAGDWAAADRARYESVFLPIENQFIEDAVNYDTPARRAEEAAKAAASVRSQASMARGAQQRQMAAMGVNPASGRATETAARSNMAEGLAVVGAKNAAEQQVENTGRMMMGQAVNLGQGLAMNPGTSLALAGDLNSSALNASMGLEELAAQQSASMWGGLGSLAGAGLSMLSSKDAKTGKKPARGALRAVENMPVEEWEYKAGMGDGGGKRHVGPYAEDFKRETGRGDGKTIPVVDAIGTTMGAVKELSAKVDRLDKRVRGAMKAAA